MVTRRGSKPFLGQIRLVLGLAKEIDLYHRELVVEAAKSGKPIPKR
jgi:hypothetical protein